MALLSDKVSPQLKWNRANAHKIRAHEAVRQALRHGDLQRGRCVVCNSFRVQFHHTNGYDPANYLVGEWRCAKHHQQVHAEERRALGVARKAPAP